MPALIERAPPDVTSGPSIHEGGNVDAILQKLSRTAIRAIQEPTLWRMPFLSASAYVEAYAAVTATLMTRKSRESSDAVYAGLVNFFEEHCKQVSAVLAEDFGFPGNRSTPHVARAHKRYAHICNVAAMFFQYLDRFYVEQKVVEGRTDVRPLLLQWEHVWASHFPSEESQDLDAGEAETTEAAAVNAEAAAVCGDLILALGPPPGVHIVVPAFTVQHSRMLVSKVNHSENADNTVT